MTIGITYHRLLLVTIVIGTIDITSHKFIQFHYYSSKFPRKNRSFLKVTSAVLLPEPIQNVSLRLWPSTIGSKLYGRAVATPRCSASPLFFKASEIAKLEGFSLWTTDFATNIVVNDVQWIFVWISMISMDFNRFCKRNLGVRRQQWRTCFQEKRYCHDQ